MQIERSKEKLSLLSRANRNPYLFSACSALFFILSFPPFPFPFFIYFAFVPLLLVLESIDHEIPEGPFSRLITNLSAYIRRFLSGRLRFTLRTRKIFLSRGFLAFRYTYLTFFAWNLACTYWLFGGLMENPSHPNAQGYAWTGLIVNLLNPVFMSIPLLCYFLVKHSRITRLSWLAFVTLWISMEWLQLQGSITWPWLNIGHSMGNFPLNIQYIEFTGALGISLQILLVNMCVFLLCKEQGKLKASFIRYGLGIVCLIILPFVLNIFLLDSDRKVFQESHKRHVRLVQTGNDPFDKGPGTRADRQIDRLIQEIESPGIDSMDLIILPEHAIPSFVFSACLRESSLFRPFWGASFSYKVPILAGYREMVYYSSDQKDIPQSAMPYQKHLNKRLEVCEPYLDGFYALYNASVLIDTEMPPQHYRKQALIPYIERVPFENLVNGTNDSLPAQRPRTQGFSEGFSEKGIRLGTNVRIGVLLSQEGIYAHIARQHILDSAQVLVIQTNDGWWGNSPGYLQQVAIQRLRSIETRRAIARVSQKGRSIFFDEKGRTLAATAPREKDHVDQSIPFLTGETFYVLHGDWIAYICLTLGLIILIAYIYVSFTIILQKLGLKSHASLPGNRSKTPIAH